jgi:hypothetical protein
MNLKLATRRRSFEEGENLRLGIKSVSLAHCRFASPRPAFARKQQAERRMLAVAKAAADFEQPHRRRAAIKLRRAGVIRVGARPHHLHVLAIGFASFHSLRRRPRASR